jgi:hypothetical protein
MTARLKARPSKLVFFGVVFVGVIFVDTGVDG